ncbi:ABC transporter permease [Inhella sp.]|uniref:ABC transporter permease n=1 Tax=Inhella sp. TaxID=1921806 RepID=UPI0035AE44E3
MALIELRGIARHYRIGDIEVRALDGVDLAIEAGEFVAIMGQSGSGKSTLMNVLGCLDNPTDGQFVIQGQDASTLGPDELAALRREHFGFIFQRYHLLPHLDARGNAALPAIYAGVGGAKRSSRAQALLERLGLGTRLHHKPSELSGGQQQRVSIARALMNGGQIILADEPTGALDSASGAELLKLLRELNERGHTVIIVTHDAGVAAHARRTIELKDGRVVRDDGTPAGHHPPAEPPESHAPPPGGWLRRVQVQWREAIATAWLSLKGNRLRTALSMLGISIGIASVVSIVALTNAARDTFEGEFASAFAGKIWFWTGNPDLPPGMQPPLFTPKQVDALAALPGVSSVLRERQTGVSARHGTRDVAAQAMAGGPDLLKERTLRIKEGRNFSPFEQAEGAQVALLDLQTVKKLFKDGQSPLGKTIFLGAMAGAAGGPEAVAVPGAPPVPPSASMPYRVIGVVESASQMGFSFGNQMIYLPERNYRAKLDASANLQAFAVNLEKGTDPQPVVAQARHRLRALRGSEDFGQFVGDEEFKKFQNFNAGFAALLAGVGAIALIVGGVGVMNIMLVSVSERTREIGIRMAVGARQSDVRLQFLIEAVVLCCLGGLVGVGLSWLGAQGLNAAQQLLRVSVDWQALAVAFLVSSAVGLLFGTVPARRAAALSPVDALARE